MHNVVKGVSLHGEVQGEEASDKSNIEDDRSHRCLMEPYKGWWVTCRCGV